MTLCLDLAHHFSIKSAPQISKIIEPLSTFGIKHFRYLKLYCNGERIVLSNYPDCTRYIYEGNRYQKMWFDGEFPQYLKEGAYAWQVNRLQDDSEEEQQLELEINTVLGLYHGITFVQSGPDYYEIYSFDTEHAHIYEMHKKIFLRFILYFKQEAKSLIIAAESEKLILPTQQPIHAHLTEPDSHELNDFLAKTKINRYYLHGKYENVYLTHKEVRCIYWLIQGKTAEETAIIEGNTAKTVRCHIDRVKEKLNCYRQTQLVKIVLETGLFDVL